MTGKVPNFEDVRIVDTNGMLTPIWKNIIQNLIGYLQQNHSQEGLVSPQQPTANINVLETTQSVGAMIYDSDTDQYKICEKTGSTTAEFRTITTSKKL